MFHQKCLLVFQRFGLENLTNKICNLAHLPALFKVAEITNSNIFVAVCNLNSFQVVNKFEDCFEPLSLLPAPNSIYYFFFMKRTRKLLTMHSEKSHVISSKNQDLRKSTGKINQVNNYTNFTHTWCNHSKGATILKVMNSWVIILGMICCRNRTLIL